MISGLAANPLLDSYWGGQGPMYRDLIGLQCFKQIIENIRNTNTWNHGNLCCFLAVKYYMEMSCFYCQVVQKGQLFAILNLREFSNTSDPIVSWSLCHITGQDHSGTSQPPPIYDFKNGRGNWRHSEGTGLQRVVWRRWSFLKEFGDPRSTCSITCFCIYML